MNISNFIQMNDWNIKNFFITIFAFQIAFYGFIGLDFLGLEIPIFRQLISFFFLIYIPGIIILRILKLHELGNTKTLLYSVGLSITILMFAGYFMNVFYPKIGISEPISIIPLLTMISLIVIILCILSYVRDKEFSRTPIINIKSLLSPPVLFLLLIPFVAIFGTYFVNKYNNNILIMFLIVLIVIIIILIGFNKLISKNKYHLSLFIITISLLFHRSLISMYIWGWDINYEYYLSNLVVTSSFWDMTIPLPVNAMLSITMLAPIFSKLCGLSLIWVFKIFYPLLFSLVPIGLYEIFRKQTNDKIAFLSCFFFIAIPIFFGEMITLARQQIAELFLVLLILLIIDKNINKTKRSVLLIIFGFSLTVSHYGLSYIYMFSIIFVWLILVVLQNQKIVYRLKNIFFFKSNNYKNIKIDRKKVISKTKYFSITLNIVLLFFTFTILWYAYVSSSTPFKAIVDMGDNIIRAISTEVLSTNSVQGLDLIISETMSPLRSITKYFYLATQFLIIIGIITLRFWRNKLKIEKEYAAFLYVMLAICLAGISIPYVSSALNTGRLYHITLIFLAPFCVIGGISILKIICKVVRKSWNDNFIKQSMKFFSIFFVIFFLFTTGFVYEITNDDKSFLSKNKDIYYPIFNEQEILCTRWVTNFNHNNTIYVDNIRRWLFIGICGECYKDLPNDNRLIKSNSTIYLGSYNINEKKVVIRLEVGTRSVTENIDSEIFVKNKNKIYNSRGAEVYN